MKILNTIGNFLAPLVDRVETWLLKHSAISHAIVAVFFTVACALVLPFVFSLVNLVAGLILGSHLIPAFLSSLSPCFGALYAVAYYHGREKRDYENRTGDTKGHTWWRGLFPKVPDLIYPYIAAPAAVVVIFLV